MMNEFELTMRELQVKVFLLEQRVSKTEEDIWQILVEARRKNGNGEYDWDNLKPGGTD